MRAKAPPKPAKAPAKPKRAVRPPRLPKPPVEPPPLDWTYIFDKDMKKCYGRVDDREMWKLAIFITDTMRDAAREVGIDAPKGAIAIRGTSPDDARDRHIRYLERKRLEAAGLFIPYHKRRKLRREAEAKKGRGAKRPAKKRP